MNKLKTERGSALLTVFIVLVTLSAITLAFLNMVKDDIKRSGSEQADLKSYYIAEAGLAKARWALTTGGQAVGWTEADAAFGAGTYTVTTTDNGDGTYTIISEGYLPTDTNPIAKRRVTEKNITAASSGLTNLSLGATATASSSKGGSTPGDANDGASNTKWTANGTPSVGSPQWLAIDFGSSKTFDRVVFDEPLGNQITSYQIQYSTNGSSWSAVSGTAASRVGTITTVNFTAVTARYHRIYITASIKKDPSISEYESYDTNESVSMILGQGKFVTTW